MNENHEEDEQSQEDKTKDAEEDDLQTYLSEMENLSTDFSDLDDLDMDELQEMQSAITKVQDGETFEETGVETSIEGESKEVKEYLEQKEALMTDFSDMEDLDLDDLKDMQAAIEGVREEDDLSEDEGAIQPHQQVSAELEARLKEELAKKKEEEAEEVITPEMFLAYIKEKRDKIWYHALWHITFEVDDHIASKELFYEVLKEVTSKSAIDPIPYHQFVFGLGYILRLNVNTKQVVRYMAGGKFKININLENLKEWLEIAGEPISKRPIITQEERKGMFSDFLKDDFLDI